MQLFVWFIVMLAAASSSSAFAPPRHSHVVLEHRRAKATATTTTTILLAKNNPISSFLEEIGDMLSRMDDVVDDFMAKRMGNGEVFYGKRKYKPSGRPNTEGKYSGMGLSDKTRIDVTREFKEQREEELRQQRRERESS